MKLLTTAAAAATRERLDAQSSATIKKDPPCQGQRATIDPARAPAPGPGTAWKKLYIIYIYIDDDKTLQEAETKQKKTLFLHKGIKAYIIGGFLYIYILRGKLNLLKK